MQEMHGLYWQCFLQVEASSLHAPSFDSEKHIVRQHFKRWGLVLVFFSEGNIDTACQQLPRGVHCQSTLAYCK